jgi:hypothetical protein
MLQPRAPALTGLKDPTGEGFPDHVSQRIVLDRFLGYLSRRFEEPLLAAHVHCPAPAGFNSFNLLATVVGKESFKGTSHCERLCTYKLNGGANGCLHRYRASGEIFTNCG